MQFGLANLELPARIRLERLMTDQELTRLRGQRDRAGGARCDGELIVAKNRGRPPGWIIAASYECVVVQTEAEIPRLPE